ncbi:hypothetical protein DFH01_22730 [Falsiroseomonas bella]|uniref:VWFA domain-containing protein n=1 Tax=Falsiroseomonas bella TaxID=2184016 RepID=A0A317F9G6_9PROT|nr:DUF1194 domain-containing protein [Falsiroseomonas bella]PWS35132.1 hypothetical protein DFH01_22730 [Falsiroseomonas bella]
MASPDCLAAIVLLLDTSASVSDRLYVAQRDGTASAFETSQVTRAIEEQGAVAAMVMEFAFVALVRLEWTLLRDRADATRFAARFRALQRSDRTGNTAVGHAVASAMRELSFAPCAPQARLIDISTDGIETTPRLPAAKAREAALAEDVTINAILFPPPRGDMTEAEAAAGLAEAEAWLRSHVATGFVRVATEEEGFALAFQRKAVTELTAIRRREARGVDAGQAYATSPRLPRLGSFAPGRLSPRPVVSTPPR